jgi:hypothetical protein
MVSTAGQILQFNDLVSTRKCALRIAPEDSSLPLAGFLDKYLKQAPIQLLLKESRITQQSADSLYAIQDLVYASSDSGNLMDMFPRIAFKQEGHFLGLEEVPAGPLVQIKDQEVSIIEIAIDRIDAGYDRNWAGFHRRKWAKNEKRYANFVRGAIEGEFGSGDVDAILQLDSTNDKLRLVQALGRAIWNSQFENYSRFMGKKLVYKSGDETIDNIIQGAGAVCSEKVQALKFLTDHYGLSSEYIIAGENADGPVPVEKLRELLTTFDFRFSKRYMRFWQHTALLYDIDGVRVLVDATNGNIPFLFLKDTAAGHILDHPNQVPVTVKMVESEEDFFYHRVPQDIPENLFFALEGWWTYSDLMQVFENELGLYLSSEFYITPITFKSEKEFHKDTQEYLNVCQRAGLESSITGTWTLDSPLGERFLDAEPEVGDKILLARGHLLARLDECDGPGHESGLVIIKLRN